MALHENQGPTTGVTPHLTILDRRGHEAVKFYKQAFAATEAMPPHLAGGVPGMAGGVPGMAEGDDRIMHAHLKVNGGSLMLNDAFPEFTEGAADHQAIPAHTTLHLQVDDADAWFDRAVAAGATVSMPLADQFWGDRYGQLMDPFGHSWSIGGPAKA